MPLSNRGTYKLTDRFSRKYLAIFYYIGIESFYKSFEYTDENREEMIKLRQKFIDSTPEINKIDQVICVKAKYLMLVNSSAVILSHVNDWSGALVGGVSYY